MQSVGIGRADVAQLVAHHLAKVDVAGSSPVVRSEPQCQTSALQEDVVASCFRSMHGGVAERRGTGLQILLHGFKSRLHLHLTSGYAQIVDSR